MLDGHDRSVAGRVLAIVDVTAAWGAPVSLAELARATGLPKSTARRIAADLAHRRILDHGPDGYVLGPEVVRLGEAAELQQAFAGYRPVVEELHRTFGGLVWLLAGRELPALRIVNLACEPGFTATALAGLPLPDRRTNLINTAAGRVILAHRPALLERVARGGLAPVTPYSPRDAGELHAIVRRVRDEGVAVEREESMAEWSCAAVELRERADRTAVLGIAVRADRTTSGQLVRRMASALVSSS